MSSETSLSSKIKLIYSEMTDGEQETLTEIALNALKQQEKADKTLYFKDLAQIVKQELDNQRGFVYISN